MVQDDIGLIHDYLGELRSPDFEKEIAEPDRTEPLRLVRAGPVDLSLVEEQEVLNVLVEDLDDDGRNAASVEVVSGDSIDLGRVEIARVEEHEPVRYLQSHHHDTFSKLTMV